MSLLRGETRSATWDEIDGAPSGRPVSPDMATHLGPVFAAFRAITDYVSTLPVDFFRKDGEQRVPVAPPMLVQNVEGEVNGGFPTWLGQLAYGLVSRGNAVGSIVPGAYGSDGKPQIVRWARSWSGGDDPETFFLDGRAMPDRLVAHVPWMVRPGHRLGMSPIEHFAAIVRAGMSAQDYADVKRGGGLPPAHLKNVAKTLNTEQATAFRDAAVAAFATGKPFVSGNDWDLSLMTIPPNHAQFIETLKLSANQIAAIYGIDPREIGGAASESLTYSNDESRALNRAHNLRPYIVRIERAVSAMLPAATYMRLNVDGTIRADVRTRTDVIGAKLKDGRLNLDEARALDDMPPLPNRLGQKYNVPTITEPAPANRNGD